MSSLRDNDIVIPVHEMQDNKQHISPSICRLCLRDDNTGTMISPCLCTDTQQYVHSSCLERYRIDVKNPVNYYSCDECREPFNIKNFCYDNVNRKQYARYYGTLVCEFVGSVLAFNVISIIVGMSLYSKDSLESTKGNGTLPKLLEFFISYVVGILCMVLVCGLVAFFRNDRQVDTCSNYRISLSGDCCSIIMKLLCCFAILVNCVDHSIQYIRCYVKRHVANIGRNILQILDMAVDRSN
jgi:hypothetical protein